MDQSHESRNGHERGPGVPQPHYQTHLGPSHLVGWSSSRAGGSAALPYGAAWFGSTWFGSTRACGTPCVETEAPSSFPLKHQPDETCWGWGISVSSCGGFKDFLCSSLFGEMIQFDLYFSNGLKTPTRYRYLVGNSFQIWNMSFYGPKWLSRHKMMSHLELSWFG